MESCILQKGPNFENGYPKKLYGSTFFSVDALSLCGFPLMLLFYVTQHIYISLGGFPR